MDKVYRYHAHPALRTILLIPLLFMAAAAISQGKKAQKKPLSIGAADTLFTNRMWNQAREVYESHARSAPEKIQAITWNRLGFCYQNLGNYNEALKNYEKAVAVKPPGPLKPILDSRLSRTYAMLNNKEKSLQWLDSAVRTGYANLTELDTLKDYNTIRSDNRFTVLYKRAYGNAYPCSVNARNREFDFWIGEWDVYQTGTTTPKVGRSVIQNASGGCMVLENWTSLNGAYDGKSMNYVDIVSGTWEQDWIGSDGRIVRFTKGEYKDGAMHFVFEAVQPDGKKLPGRFTFFNQGPDQVRQFSEQSPDNGTTWQTNYDFTYIRRK